MLCRPLRFQWNCIKSLGRWWKDEGREREASNPRQAPRSWTWHFETAIFGVRPPLHMCEHKSLRVVVKKWSGSFLFVFSFFPSQENWVFVNNHLLFSIRIKSQRKLSSSLKKQENQNDLVWLWLLCSKRKIMALIMTQFAFQSKPTCDKVVGEGQILIFFLHEGRYLNDLPIGMFCPGALLPQSCWHQEWYFSPPSGSLPLIPPHRCMNYSLTPHSKCVAPSHFFS